MRKNKLQIIKRASFPWQHKTNKINCQEMRFLMKPWFRYLTQHISRYLLPSKRTGKKKDLSQIKCATVCVPKYARRSGFSTSLPPSHGHCLSLCQVSEEVPSTAGAHTNTLHDPLIPSPRCKIKVSLPLHVVFETSASNQWSLMKWNLFSAIQEEKTYSDNHLWGPSSHLVKAMPKVISSKLD